MEQPSSPFEKKGWVRALTRGSMLEWPVREQGPVRRASESLSACKTTLLVNDDEVPSSTGELRDSNLSTPAPALQSVIRMTSR